MSPGLAERPLFKQAAVLIDGLFSIVSCTCILFLLALALLWCVEPVPTQTFYTDLRLHSTPGGTVDVSPGVSVHTEARKALYRYWLTDEHGHSVYVYPDRVAEDPTNLVLNRSIELPDSLKAGQYTLQVELLYPFNPFKTGSVYVRLATIDVD